MNARQKAKKYKKELDRIKNEPFKRICEVNPFVPEHYRVFQIIDNEEIGRFGEIIMKDEAKLLIKRQLINEIMKDAKINKMPCLDRFNATKYYVDIWLSYEREAKD